LFVSKEKKPTRVGRRQGGSGERGAGGRARSPSTPQRRGGAAGPAAAALTAAPPGPAHAAAQQPTSRCTCVYNDTKLGTEIQRENSFYPVHVTWDIPSEKAYDVTWS